MPRAARGLPGGAHGSPAPLPGALRAGGYNDLLAQPIVPPGLDELMSDLHDNPMGTDGFEFVEYTAPDPQLLRTMFERLGLPLTACVRIVEASPSMRLFRARLLGWLEGAVRQCCATLSSWLPGATG